MSEKRTGTETHTHTPTGTGTGLRGPRALVAYGIVTLVGAGIDLATKHIAFEKIGPYDVITVIPGFFNLIRSENRGAAFGILGGAFGFFVLVSIVALLVLGYFSWTAVRSGAGYQVTLGLVAAGVVGNLHDRVRYGVVRDFFDAYVSQAAASQWLRERFGTNHWPTFNVADSCICVGVAFLLVKFWSDEKKHKRREEIHDVNRDSRV